jgi:hypothetical protein
MADKNRGYESGGVAFAGCIVLGTGIGMAADHTLAGLIIGAGAGFIVMAIFRAIGR